MSVGRGGYVVDLAWASQRPVLATRRWHSYLSYVAGVGKQIGGSFPIGHMRQGDSKVGRFVGGWFVY